MSRSQGSPPPGTVPHRRPASGQDRAPHNPYPNLPPLTGAGQLVASQAREPSLGRAYDTDPQYHYPNQPAGYQPQPQPPQQQPHGYPQQRQSYPPPPQSHEAYDGAPYPHPRDPEPVGYAAPAPRMDPYRGAPPHLAAQADPRLDLRGTQFDQGWPQQQRDAQPDPGHYDLGAYAAPQGYAPASGRPPAAPQATLANAAANARQYPEPYPEDWEEQQPALRAYQDGRGTQVQAVEEHYDDEVEYEEEEPRRGGRRWLVIGALLASIAVGGAMAYVYKKYVVASAGNGKPPVVRASKEPQKEAPADAGGKKFAGSDSRYLGRLEQDGNAAAAETDSNGVRKVQTLAVGRDGSLGAPAPVLPPQQAAPAGGMALPGAIFEGFGRPGQGAAPPPPPTQPVIQPVQRQPVAPVAPPPAPPRQPQVIAKAAPAPIDPVEAPVQTAARAPAPPKQAVPKAAPPAAAAQGGTSGFVCVLASTGSRMDALKRFADMQQKYGALSDKVPEVKEVDLSSRGLGTMYRLMAGPPASRESAASLCTQLKASGLAGDPWVTAY